MRRSPATHHALRFENEFVRETHCLAGEVKIKGREFSCGVYLHSFVSALKSMERVKGIEPSSQAWEAHILPLNHTRSDLAFLANSNPKCNSNAVRNERHGSRICSIPKRQLPGCRLLQAARAYIMPGTRLSIPSSSCSGPRGRSFFSMRLTLGSPEMSL
jgi:hypothetical protein